MILTATSGCGSVLGPAGRTAKLPLPVCPPERVTVGTGFVPTGDGGLRITEREWRIVNAWIDDWQDCAKKRGLVIEEANR